MNYEPTQTLLADENNIMLIRVNESKLLLDFYLSYFIFHCQWF